MNREGVRTGVSLVMISIHTAIQIPEQKLGPGLSGKAGPGGKCRLMCLNLPCSSVSKLIRDLEARLGIKLVERTTSASAKVSTASSVAARFQTPD